MTPGEMTTVELLRETASYLRDEHGHFDAANALAERAERLANVLKVAETTGDPREPFDNGSAAMFAAYELARKLNAAGTPRGGR